MYILYSDSSYTARDDTSHYKVHGGIRTRTCESITHSLNHEYYKTHSISPKPFQEHASKEGTHR